MIIIIIIVVVVVVVLVLVIIIFIIVILIPLHYSNGPQSRIIYDGLQADCTTDFLGDTSLPHPPSPWCNYNLLLPVSLVTIIIIIIIIITIIIIIRATFIGFAV